MKTSLCKNVLLLISLVTLVLRASEVPCQTPTIDFSSASLRELVEYQRNNNVAGLTPRSKQSYTNRFRHLSRDRFNDLRARLSTIPEAQAQPIRGVLFIRMIPAATQVADTRHARAHETHGLDCICHLLDQLMLPVAVQDQAHQNMDSNEDAHDITTHDVNGYRDALGNNEE